MIEHFCEEVPPQPNVGSEVREGIPVQFPSAFR